jgi:(E)-4-hydroxy-3-methyl-but-2-enyl pyrophosphate reductase
MKIIIAEESGLCYGVKRALNIARTTRKCESGPVSTLGDLIHNPGVIAELESRGIGSAASLSEIRGGTVIIRSHGVSPEIRRRLARKKVDVVDATCPIVRKIQELAGSLARAGREIVIVGDREHPETQGLLGYSRGRGIVVENESEARALPRRASRAVLAQSTMDVDRFAGIVAALVERTDDLAVRNTICRSTRVRRDSTRALAARVDAMFIVGGRKSSNTGQLHRISKRVQPRTYFIESAAEITPAMLRGAGTIGISGGASTPPGAIREAVTKIKANFKS